ncbi:MAG TPA: hypothetical protein VFH06_01785 [Candidatus Saccharimonadales bacterium]|nr:hypothetical protein [Candidatus Saccharimonadales bacterium]
MSTERDGAVSRLLDAIEGLNVQQINDLARKAELIGGWQMAMENAADRAKTGNQERRPDADELIYRDLVVFCEEIGAPVEVASVAWNRLHGKRGGFPPNQTNELRRTPITVRKLRSAAAGMPSGSRHDKARQDEQLVMAWEKTL